MSRALPQYQTKRTPELPNRLERIAAIADAIGMPLLPWVSDALAVATEYEANGEPHRRKVLWTVPRQSSKSVGVGTVVIDGLLAEPDLYSVYVAQTREAARKRLAGIAKLLVASGLDTGAKFTKGVGNERLVCSNGSVCEVASPNATSIHGDALDFAVLDELFAIDPILMQAVTPAMAARPMAQLWMISTAGTLAESELLNDLRAKGRADPDGPMAFVEYSKPDEMHAYDEDGWWLFHPGLGHTISVKHLREEAASMKLPDFLRAYCNITTAVDALAFPTEWWTRSSEAIAVPETIALSFDVSRKGSMIAAAFPTEDERWHVDPIEYREGGAEWIPQRLTELVARFNVLAIAVDSSGPAKALMPEVKALTESYGIALRSFGVADRCVADGHLFNMLKDERMSHGDLEALTEAVGSTPAKTHGDLWRFDREGAAGDPSPLIAMSLAAFADYEAEVLAPKPAIFFG